MAVQRQHELCLVCGKPSLRLICPICARKLNEEAQREHSRHESQEMREKVHHG
jgi:predicted amidophosphoribosyltransferase